jgi:hypothetical protein
MEELAGRQVEAQVQGLEARLTERMREVEALANQTGAHLQAQLSKVRTYRGLALLPVWRIRD